MGKIENEFIVLDKGKGKDKRGEKEKEFKKDVSLLELELSKLRHRSILSEKGMIPFLNTGGLLNALNINGLKN